MTFKAKLIVVVFDHQEALTSAADVQEFLRFADKSFYGVDFP
jgi:hypothetical protein